MRKNLKHLRVDLYKQNDTFKSKRTGRNPDIPLNDREGHGGKILKGYSKALAEHDGRSDPNLERISDDSGIYVELTSHQGVAFPIASLDTTAGYKLKSLHVEDGREIAVVFVPDNKRHLFETKIRRYLDPSKDGQNGPANHNLIDSIEHIRLADLKSFWTDSLISFPQDRDTPTWMELWLTDKNGDALVQVEKLSQRYDIPIRPTILRFHKTVVVLIFASIKKLEISMELISCLEELRQAKETPQVVVTMNPREQREWVSEIQARVHLEDNSNVSVAILDTGVNHNNPLLSVASQAAWCKAWNPAWPIYTDNAAEAYHAHGSLQAGIALYGDLMKIIGSADNFVIPYRIESGRILPPSGDNDPDLYGAITTQTADILQTEIPDRRRVFSLAVTSTPEALGGQPSSWSAEIDAFTYGTETGAPQLMIVSTGNNRDIEPTTPHWDQANLSQIEDPAQAWNVLTVGGFTELATNDDPLLVNWEPWCTPGDLAPAARTSVNWGWKKQAPYKPDLVAEAGNRLISPEQTELTDADCVSVLTTSGRAAGALFDTTRDTSAATALATHYSALLMCEYPEYWPETIRALLIHSAEWTKKMLDRKVALEGSMSKSRAAQLMLRSYGYGVPDLDRARYSADHLLTLVAQEELRPFVDGSGPDAKLGDMHYYSLPWPADALGSIDPATPVRLKVTLSYFVEPNPGRRGYRNRFSYQSHGLRFEVSRPGQSEENFRGFVNKLLEAEDYDGPEGDLDGWWLGSQMRTRGSVHSDTWEGTAAALLDMKRIAVVPVSGWWKYRASEGRWDQPVRYSLVVSVIVPDENLDVDIYSPVENQINVLIASQAIVEI